MDFICEFVWDSSLCNGYRFSSGGKEGKELGNSSFHCCSFHDIHSIIQYSLNSFSQIIR